MARARPTAVPSASATRTPAAPSAMIELRQVTKQFAGKLEYSQAVGQHWRATAGAVLIGGRSGDFLGQYNRNSHAALGLRYSF
jgi:hypothetical protein